MVSPSKSMYNSVQQRLKEGSYAPPNSNLNRLPSITEEEGLRRTAQIRKELHAGKDRTVAYAEVDTTGHRGDIVGVSGTTGNRELARHPTVKKYEGANTDSVVADVTGRNYREGHDAEVKILDDLRSRLSPFDQGTVRLFVDQPEKYGVCGKCAEEIIKFRKDFPGIELIVSTP